MKIEIVRDPELARQFVLQGLWFQRTVAPTASTVKPILEAAMEILAGGQPLPPIGFLADLGHAAFGFDRDLKQRESPLLPGVPSGMLRTYEDHVMGKIYADWTFERASDAMRRFQGRDRLRGLAYVVKQIRERGSIGGVEMPPGIIRSMIESAGEELLRNGWESLQHQGPMPLLLQLYEGLIHAARRMAEVLATEDVIALEQRTALADMGQYVAHRQVLQTSLRMEETLPRHKIRPLAGRQEVPTRILDEDTYPVGGFASISTKGSVESLLHSQLAFMEKDPALQPDMFDIKFLRDELYYYSRDENQFLRRRRSFVFILYPDLVSARFKDIELPCQRIVLLLSVLLATVNRLSDWLSTDALKFYFLIVQEGETKSLVHEAQLLEMLLREPIENQTVIIQAIASNQVEAFCRELSRKSLCHALLASTKPIPMIAADTIITNLIVASARPQIQTGHDPLETLEADDALECWLRTLERILQLWI